MQHKKTSNETDYKIMSG